MKKHVPLTLSSICGDKHNTDDNCTTAFTDQQEATLAAFVTDNSGEYTYAEIAGHFEDGAFSPKSIQGKILSMELTAHVKPAPKIEAVRTYTPEEESTGCAAETSTVAVRILLSSSLSRIILARSNSTEIVRLPCSLGIQSQVTTPSSPG